jgi:outer membrane protein OmpA-like peptidoglycan-associated protein
VNFNSSPAGDRLQSVQGADARGEQTLRLKVVGDYSREPLTLLAANQSAYHVVDEQLWLHAMASFALQHRVLFSLDVPLLLHQSGDPASSLATPLANPASGPALGDLRLGARVKLLGPAGKGLKLSSGGDLWVPTGADGSYGSDGAVRGQVLLSVGKREERMAWGLNAGAGFRPSRRLPSLVPLRVGKSLILSGGAMFALDAAAHWHLGPELRAESTLGDGAKLLDARSSSLQVLGTLAWRVAGGPWEATVSGGPALGQAAGSADYRALLALGWSPEAPLPLPDRDEDRVPDGSDACANIPGEPSNDPLMNGCPAVPPDFDGDAIADANDACPKVPGIPTGSRKTHGCPKAIATDAPPAVQPPPRAALVEQQITISEQVLFETGTANIDPASSAILQEVARVLEQHPEIERLEVQGHTDNLGSDEFNRVLSEQRAAAVAQWLIAHGTSGARLVSKGYGTSRPIASNDSEQGRTKNRRVEFRVLQRPTPGAQP